MKYPNGYFKEKACRTCERLFQPKAPSNHYCSTACKKVGKADAYYKRIYGITYSAYTKLLTQQHARCALCGGTGFIMNATVHHAPLVVDHDHSTGRIRGLLCHNCNRALGLFQDDPNVLRLAADYVEAREGATTRAKARRPQANGGRSAMPR